MSEDDRTNPDLWRGRLEAYQEMKKFVDTIIPVTELALRASEELHRKRGSP
jgi:hypothetical protein